MCYSDDNILAMIKNFTLKSWKAVVNTVITPGLKFNLQMHLEDWFLFFFPHLLILFVARLISRL